MWKKCEKWFINLYTEFDIEILSLFQIMYIPEYAHTFTYTSYNKYQFNKSYPMFSTPGPRSVFIPC